MYFRVTGTAEEMIASRQPVRREINETVIAHWPDQAADKAISRVQAKNIRLHPLRWVKAPTVTEIPADQIMRTLGSTVAPTLPGF